MNDSKVPYSPPTLRELHPYTEDQIRADIHLIEASDLDDDLALALMRLAHALCGSSMLRGLIAREHRKNAIVRAVIEKRGGPRPAGFAEAISPVAGMLASEAAANAVDAHVLRKDKPWQRCAGKPFLGFTACCGGVVEGDRAHRCRTEPIPDGCAGCGKPRAPGSWCCPAESASEATADEEPAGHCGMCSAEYSAAEYAKLDSAQASHFRGCTKCGHYEVVPS